MTSARQHETNRINARRSTGPRTPGGKLRASRNAVRHGFTLPVSHDPAAAPHVVALAHAIAGAPGAPGSADALAEPAHRVAEAQVDLVRVRRARHKLFAQALAGRESATPQPDLPTVRALLTSMVGPEWAPLARYLPHAPEHPGDLRSLLTRFDRRLRALDRYERRARARRRAAVRDLDRARRAARQAEA